jgi:hypothetical protein
MPTQLVTNFVALPLYGRRPLSVQFYSIVTTDELYETGIDEYGDLGIDELNSPSGIHTYDSIYVTPLGVTFGTQTFLWDFGDGIYSTLENPSHTYTKIGKYTVTLTVTDSLIGSDTESKTNYITILPGMPNRFVTNRCFSMGLMNE